jgi:protein SCO1/2
MLNVEQTSETELRRLSMRAPWGLIVGALVLAVAVSSILLLHQRQAPSVGGPFALTDAATGQQVSDRDFQGKWLLVFFGYTHCPDVCPTTLNNIAEAMTQLGRLAEQVQPIFITVDPDRDTRQVIVDYTTAFDPRIIGLSGSSDQIAAAAKAYRIYYAKRVIGDDYYMDHTATVHVMRPDRTYSSSILPTAGPTDITRQLRRLIGNSGK